MVTFHPVTLEYEEAEHQVTELLAALEASGMPTVFTMPNSDTGNEVIREKGQQFVAQHGDSQLVENFGIQAYLSMMNIAAVMVGNSSSGILEAAPFALPVVNVGTRQSGRVRARNVIDVGSSRQMISGGITRAASPEFRARLRALVNPYRSGNASQAITERLRTVQLGDTLTRKKFYSIPASPENDPEA
jgi:UDP-hydrolysing UDP-N-acetyl-D-glucosamine 2-epimerase